MPRQNQWAAPAVRSASHRYIAGLLLCGYAVAFTDRGLVGVASAPITHDLALSDTQYGLLNGPAFVALFCLCAVPLGWLADRIQRGKLIAAGMLFWSLMTAGCALGHSFAAILLTRVGVGLGEACLLPAGVSLLVSVTPPQYLARSIAVFLVGATLGNAIALLAGGEILTAIGTNLHSLAGFGPTTPWRVLFLLASVPGIILAPLFATLREPPRSHTSGLGRPLESLRDALSLLGEKRAAYGFLTASTACIVLLAQTQAAWVPLFYVRAFGLTPGESAMTVGLLFLVSAPAGQWLGGVLIDHLHSRGSAAAPHIAQAACSILCIPAAWVFCTASQIGCSEAAYATFNLLVFAATPAGLTGWQALTPERSRGLVIALLVATVTLIGVGLGPVIVGFLNDRVLKDEGALGVSLLVVDLGAALAAITAAVPGALAFSRATRACSNRAEPTRC